MGIVTLRSMTREDFPRLGSWLARPHVQRWWKETGAPDEVERKYGPHIDGADPTRMFVAEVDGVPIGMLQTYWVDDYPEHAESVGLPGAVGVDLFIGEPDYLGRGYGPAMLRAFLSTVVPGFYSGATGAVADPSASNGTSIRAFEKAGFRKGRIVEGEDGLEQLMVLEFGDIRR